MTPSEPSVLTVSQLTQSIRQNLEGAFPALWLKGEVSNCKLHSSGHLYFSLKDSQAQIAAIMFRGHASTLPRVPKDGDEVIVYGGITVYPQAGRYQMQVLELRFAGIGELLLRLEELKKKLHKKGWFSKEHKKPIPKAPRTIGIVTSPTGAVIQDILNILSRRLAGFHVILNPVRVQGEGAAQEIAKAIEQFNETALVDVMIVCRGGGSIEDLWAFNEEIVAEAIFRSKIPIIAAVGHETDHCIAEYVADMRAPTPSAAAELVMAEKAQQIEKLLHARKQCDHFIRNTLRQCQKSFDAILKQPAFRNPYLLLGPWMQRLDAIKQGLDNALFQLFRKEKAFLEEKRKFLYSLNPQTQLIQARKRAADLARQLDQSMYRTHAARKERLERVISALKGIDPKNLLGRGYAILFSEIDRSVITSARGIKKDDPVRLLLADGEILANVKETIVHHEK